MPDGAAGGGRRSRTRRWLDGVLDLVVPPACVVCGCHLPPGPRGEHRRVCPRCITRLPPIAPPRCPRCAAPRDPQLATEEEEGCRDCREWPALLAGAASATLLEGPASELVHAFKYGGWPELAREMSRPLARLHGRLPPPFRRVPLVPVPTTRARLRRRGYNQAEVLARALATRVGQPVLTPLSRVAGSASQVALHRSERRANVRGAFAPMEGSDPLPPRLVVVDDVLTTGATVVEVAETLVAGGAREIFALSFARARVGAGAAKPGGPANAPARLLDALGVRRAGRRASGPHDSSSNSSDLRS